MKTLKILVLVLLFAKSSNGQGIKFGRFDSWSAVKEKAKAENKFIFLDIFATWCGPCKVMDNIVYSSTDVGNFYNKNFISLKLQMDKTVSDLPEVKSWYKDAALIGKEFEITGYPTLLYFSPDGKLVRKEVGAVNGDFFLWIGQKVIDPNTGNYVSEEDKIKKRVSNDYKNGRRDGHTVREMARQSVNKSKKDSVFAFEIANRYIDKLNKDSIFTKDNAWFVYEFTNSSQQRGFNILKDFGDRIEKVEPRLASRFTQARVMSIIATEKVYPLIKNNQAPDWGLINKNASAFGKHGHEAVEMVRAKIALEEIAKILNATSVWKIIQMKIDSLNFSYIDKEKIIQNIVRNCFNSLSVGKTSNVQLVVDAGNAYYNQYKEEIGAGILNQMAWIAFLNVTDKNLLKVASEWAKCGIEKDPKSPNEYDTYANILYKLGDVKEALEWEQKAIQIAPDNVEIRANYEKMKFGQITWPIK